MHLGHGSLPLVGKQEAQAEILMLAHCQHAHSGSQGLGP